MRQMALAFMALLAFAVPLEAQADDTYDPRLFNGCHPMIVRAEVGENTQIPGDVVTMLAESRLRAAQLFTDEPPVLGMLRVDVVTLPGEAAMLTLAFSRRLGDALATTWFTWDTVRPPGPPYDPIKEAYFAELLAQSMQTSPTSGGAFLSLTQGRNARRGLTGC